MTDDTMSTEQLLARTLAAAGGPAWARVRTLRFEGRMRVGGLDGPCEQWLALETGRHAMRLTLGPATMAGGFDGVHAWQRGPNGEVVVQDAEAGLRAAATEAWIHARGWWFPARHPASFDCLGRREVDGVAFDVLRCVPAGGQWVELWFDARSHRLARLVQEVLGKPSLRRFDDEREVQGLRLPFRVTSGNGDPRFDRELAIEAVTVDAEPPADAFEAPQQAFSDVSFAGGATQVRLPFVLLNNHVFVAAQIDGHPLRLLLDTGGVNLLSMAAAHRIGLESLGAIETRGPGAQSVGSGFARVDRLEIGGVALERQLLRVIDLPGFDDVEGTRVDGVLGVELFKRLVLRIDYARRELLLADPSTFTTPSSEASHALPITFFGHFPGIAAELDGLPGQFWLDTGNRSGVVLLEPFVETHRLAERYPLSGATTIGWGIGGPVQGRLARGGRLALGGLHVEAPVLRLPDGHGGALAIRHVAGNIGGEILRRFVVTFDYARRVVHLEPNTDAGQPFDVDRSGLWINRHAQGAVVAAVMADGPAAQAGLHVDDVIVAVAGEPASVATLDALRRRLAESPAGSRVALELRRGEQAIQAALVLRDLV